MNGKRLMMLAGLAVVVGLWALWTPGTSQSAEGWNKLSWNRLLANRLVANRLQANRLASIKLGANKLAINSLGAGDLLATDDGRQVLSYLVSCALPADMTLVATQGTCSSDADCGALSQSSCNAGMCKYEFPGGLGLAPRWADKKLSKTDKGWVSACMLARVNAHDTAEEISLRGENPALTISPVEDLIYTVEEGAFYGNIFTPANQPIIAIACQGEGQASGEFGGLVLRDCAEPDPGNPGFTQCGFTFAGDCRDFDLSIPSPYACEEFESAPDQGSFYEDCHDKSGLGKWKHSKEFGQVITTFTTP